jgi:dTDP-4-amino-4,6-dideoxygalactose transaminase
LREIDATRWYSNFGPLVQRFEQRLAERFQTPTRIITLANATLALALTLRARAPRGGVCLIPAWSFAASAHAAHWAGLTPCFADVDAQSGVLTPEIARALVQDHVIAAVMPVLPFGAPIDLEAWAAFECDTGVAVVGDAAAGFDVARVAPVPLVVSLHATKALGVGEGAFLATQDEALAADVRAMSVFGFKGTREAFMPALNAKLSEYAAAVGLAALDQWPQTRRRFMQSAQKLRGALSDTPLKFQDGWGADWISATCIAELPEADKAARALALEDIETRRWWGRGLHRQPAFRTAPQAMALMHTNRLAAQTLGLPFAFDLDEAAIERIAKTLKGVLV